MEHNITVLTALASIAGLAAAATLAGLLAGLLGVGGGIILVPVLYWLLKILQMPEGIAMHMAVGTSLATIVFTSIASVRAHHAKGAIDASILRRWMPGIIVGALSGGFAAAYLDAQVLKAVFATVAVLVAINMAPQRTRVLAARLPEGRGFNWSVSYAVGALSSVMGIGGGTLSVPVLNLFSFPIHRAVGTASALGLAIAIPASAGFAIGGWGVENLPPLSLGFINVAAVAIILPFATCFAPIGARLTHSLPALAVKRVFAVFLAITALRMAVDILTS